MQRRRNYNNSTERFKYYLHSIPKLLLLKEKAKYSINEDKVVKSNVLYSIPNACSGSPDGYGLQSTNDIRWTSPSHKDHYSSYSTYNSTNAIWWRSPHCRTSCVEIGPAPAKTFMMAYSRIARWSKRLCKLASLVLLFGLFLGDGKCYAATTASLSLSNNAMVSDTVVPGDVATVNTDVIVSVTDAESYSLILSVKNTTLTNGTTTITAGNPGDSNSTNVWGYYFGDDTNPNTYTAPTTTGTTLTSSTNPTTGTALTNGEASFTKTLTFGAKFGDDANAGAYHGSGTISLIATPRVLTYILTLDPNGGNGGTNIKACEVQSGSSCTVDLSTGITTPTKTGYTFVGWADANDASSAQYSTTVVNGTSKSITLSSNKTIYAVWQSPGASWTLPNGNTLSTGIEYMQDVDKSTIPGGFCGTNVPIGSTITLKDNRTYTTAIVRNNVDNADYEQLVPNTYMIRKMKDNKCWMTQNLRINNTIITSLNSDVLSDFVVPPSSKSSFTESSKTTNNTKTTSNVFLGTDRDGNITGYYSWCAATAGTCPSSGNASYSICPKGWKLPTGGDDVTKSDFGKFVAAESIADSSAGSTKIQNSPYYFAYTGMIDVGTYKNPINNLYGKWWSSTTRDGHWSYSFSTSSSSVSASAWGGSADHYYGYAVRCLAR